MAWEQYTTSAENSGAIYMDKKIRQPNMNIKITDRNGEHIYGLYRLFNCNSNQLKKLYSWLGRLIEWKDENDGTRF